MIHYQVTTFATAVVGCGSLIKSCERLAYLLKEQLPDLNLRRFKMGFAYNLQLVHFLSSAQLIN